MLCYVLPDGSSTQSMVETNIFDRLMNSLVYINNVENENAYMLLCGDFNARTAAYPDYFADDIDRHVHVLPDEYIVDSNIDSRISQDTVRPDSNGLLLLELCRQSGLRIMNGRMGEDANIRKYTYIGSNGSSAIDYMLSLQNMLDFVQSFNIEDPNILSDHCCVKLVLELPVKNEDAAEISDTFENINGKYAWNSDLLNEYKSKLNSVFMRKKLLILYHNIVNSRDKDSINLYLMDFNELLSEVCSPFFKNCHVSSDYQYEERKENPWFNEIC